MAELDDTAFGPEFQNLDDLAKRVVRSLVRKTIDDNQARAEAFDNQDAYCYRHPGGGIAWGVNGGKFGFNIARGIYRPAKK